MDNRYFPAHLPVSTRRVLGADGSVTESKVFCPLRDQTLDVADCEACVDCVGVVEGREGQRGAVLCRRLTVESARYLGPARGAPLLRREPASEPSMAERTPVSAVMSADVHCVRDDVTVEQVTQLLVEHTISGVPVVDGHGHPIGVISKTDLLRGAASDARVSDVMTPLVFFLPERASVAQAAALMAFEGIHRLAVVADDFQLLGLVSSLDVLRWLARADGYLPPG